MFKIILSSFFFATNSLSSSIIIPLLSLDRPSSNFPFEIILDVSLNLSVVGV
jgi:hypothetical protein